MGTAVLATATFENVTTGVSNLMTVVTTMLTTITGDPILCALFVAGFVGIACGILSRLKHV